MRSTENLCLLTAKANATLEEMCQVKMMANMTRQAAEIALARATEANKQAVNASMRMMQLIEVLMSSCRSLVLNPVCYACFILMCYTRVLSLCYVRVLCSCHVRLSCSCVMFVCYVRLSCWCVMFVCYVRVIRIHFFTF